MPSQSVLRRYQPAILETRGATRLSSGALRFVSGWKWINSGNADCKRAKPVGAMLSTGGGVLGAGRTSEDRFACTS